MRRTWAAILVLMYFATTSFAHYNMLLPDKAWANKGDKVTFTYQFGHPFEHELFDAPKPVALVVVTPKSKKEIFDIDKLMTPIKKDGADGKKVTAWQFTFTPPERGDYTFVMKTAKIKHEEGKFVQDTVRVVLHVQTQNGWDKVERVIPKEFDIIPYTRPYGFLPGMVFRGKFDREQAVGSALVEIEKYNEKPMKNVPPDELITFKARTDHLGFFVASLPEPGWWGITVWSPFGPPKADEATSLRSTMWLHVDEKK